MVRHVALLLLLFLALVASIGASTTVWAARPPKLPQPAVDISIFSFGYDPSSFTVGATGKVTWRNDEGRHTVTFTNTSLDSSGKLAEGETFTANFLGVAPDTYEYYCTIHGFARMNGKVVVP